MFQNNHSCANKMQLMKSKVSVLSKQLEEMPTQLLEREKELQLTKSELEEKRQMLNLMEDMIVKRDKELEVLRRLNQDYQETVLPYIKKLQGKNILQ